MPRYNLVEEHSLKTKNSKLIKNIILTTIEPNGSKNTLPIMFDIEELRIILVSFCRNLDYRPSSVLAQDSLSST